MNAVEIYNGKKLTKDEIGLIKEHVAKGATDSELKIFLAICQRTGLDPFSRQIYLVPRWDSRLSKEVRLTQVGIDGFRTVAERTEKYAGSDDAVFEGSTEYEFGEKKVKYSAPDKATVTVWKVVEGQRYAFTGSARWSEYYPGDKMGFMWRNKPHVMLGKCAEALALRKAFPMVLAGLYIPEEIEKGEDMQKSTFDIAVEKLKALTDPKQLKSYLTKIKASEKYTDAEKHQIEQVVGARIEELKGEAPKKK